jgi:hypothetical protein
VADGCAGYGVGPDIRIIPQVSGTRNMSAKPREEYTRSKVKLILYLKSKTYSTTFSREYKYGRSCWPFRLQHAVFGPFSFLANVHSIKNEHT